MDRALRLAGRAAASDEVPVGAILVREGQVVGEGWNQPIGTHDPTAHAEIVALRTTSAALGNYRLAGVTVYATLEPCVMCIGAMLHARIERLVFGAWDPKAGACGSVIDVPRAAWLTHRIDVFGGVRSEESGALLKAFFDARRRR